MKFKALLDLWSKIPTYWTKIKKIVQKSKFRSKIEIGKKSQILVKNKKNCSKIKIWSNIKI